jgi:hypothetical protein
MMLQTVPPNRIVLWLGEESDDVALSPELVELERLGVEIRRGVENLKSHKNQKNHLRQMNQKSNKSQKKMKREEKWN